MEKTIFLAGIGMTTNSENEGCYGEKLEVIVFLKASSVSLHKTFGTNFIII